jgi:hypothetical protein
MFYPFEKPKPFDAPALSKRQRVEGVDYPLE